MLRKLLGSIGLIVAGVAVAAYATRHDTAHVGWAYLMMVGIFVGVGGVAWTVLHLTKDRSGDAS
jgi:hypothetical protein